MSQRRPSNGSLQPIDPCGPIFRFCTGDLPRCDRLSAWRDIFGRTVCSVDIDPVTPAWFRSEATVCRAPGLGILMGSTAGARLTHASETVADGGLCLMTGPMREWTVSQRGRNLVLGPGDGVLMSNADVWTMMLPVETRLVVLRVPAAAMAALVFDIDMAVARRIPGESNALRMLTRYLGVLQDPSALATARLRDLAATHVHHLLAVALGATSEATEIANGGGLRAARLQAILADITTRFADPGFSLAVVASRLGISPRYVQDVLHDTGRSFTERVTELKLCKARAMLGGTGHGAPKITDVAYDCGFDDISYFNRCFRRRFGAAPGEFRRASQ